MAQDAPVRDADARPGGSVANDAWNPGLQSRIPAHLTHLCTIFRPDNSFVGAADAAELHDLTGLPASELVAFRPRRLALHEVLIRVTANLSVPDGIRIEDLGINFRRMTQTLWTACIEPALPEIEAAYARLRDALSERIAEGLPSAIASAETPREPARSRAPLDLRRFFRRAGAAAAPRSATPDGMQAASDHALAKVVSALLVRHGEVWGDRALIAAIAVNLACNELGADAIGALIDPWLEAAARREGYRVLPRQDAPVVMNTKGPSASGKSTLRPLQRRLAADIGVEWSEFALISPDIWRKQLIDYEALGADYKYGAMFTGEELHIVDLKLDRYMARKADRGDMSHLLIDRFRFDSFAPDSDEAGSNLLTRFGRIVYLFFMITPPASLVERAWKRGLEVGRYKAVDDTLAHAVEAYSGMPELFFTWIRRTDKRVHFEFLDNAVPLGERPRTVAFGWNGTMNVLDIPCLLDVERYRRVNIDASVPALLYPDAGLLAPEHNTAFLAQCVERFPTVNFANRDTGRIYLRMVAGKPLWADDDALAQATANADARAGVAAVAVAALQGGLPPPQRPAHLHEIAGFETTRTLGRWGSASRDDAG